MDLSILEERIGVVFTNKQLLLQALTHRSYCNEHRGQPCENNERLEFLDDAVLELIVADYLFKNFPGKKEGELTDLKTFYVRGDTALQASESIGLSEFLLVSRSQAIDNPANARASKSILADAFEAVVGAIYLDRGYETAVCFVDEMILAQVEINPNLFQELVDPKSALQMMAQKKLRTTPVYKIIKETGLDHDKHFVVGVYLGNNLSGTGKGTSKRAAEQDSAKNALKKF